MTLKEIRKAYSDGKLTKPEYIVAAYKLHALLFEYADELVSTEIREIRITDGELVATTRQDDLQIIINPNEERAAVWELFNFNTFEKAEMDLLTAMIADCRTMIDVGANIGFVSLTLTTRLPQLQVAAFEPVASTFALLNRNLALNNATRVKTYNMGMAEKEGSFDLYYYEAASGNTSMANVSQRGDVTRVTAQLSTIDKFVERSGFPVEFMKVDVEGAELLVFRGAAKTLDTHRPIIIAELLRKWAAAFDYHPNEVIELLRKHGYRCYAIGADKPFLFTEMTDETTETNFVFLHPDKHQKQIGIIQA